MAEHSPVLDDLQSELVARLRTDGIAEIEFARLFSTDLWKDVTEEATTFGRETERRLTAERSSPEKTTPKELAHRRYGKDAELPLDDPWLRIAVSPRLLDVVNAYLGMLGKLSHCNQVYKAARSRGHRALGELASRRTRQTPCESGPSPLRRPGRHRPVGIRAGEYRRGAVRGAVAVGARKTPRMHPRPSSPSSCQTRPSVR